MLLLKKHGGGWRSRWYGRFKQGGKTKEVPLCRWKGTPPARGRIGKDDGDRAFEASRQRALAELREVMDGQRSDADQAALVERVHRARYGKRVELTRITDLYTIWIDRPRKRHPTEGHKEVARRTFERFVEYMKRAAPRITETGALRKEHIEGFLKDIEAEGVSARTWNGILSIMRGTMQRADPYAEATRYLRDQPAKDMATVHRTPFTGEELERIFKAAAARDPLVHDLIVTAACTAMRRGDVCRLRWSSVDLSAGFITVKTAKTGETAEVPVFPPLRTVLESYPRKGVYVFPEAEKLYRQAPDMLNRRLQAVLVDAGFVRPPINKLAGEYPKADPSDIRRIAESAMKKAGWSAKRVAKGRDILEGHLRGRGGRDVAEDLSISRGAVSTYLHELEKLTRLAIVSTPAGEGPEPSVCTVGEITPDMPRKKRPSLKSWHSFRTTWATLALAAGVPLEIVRRVTGHRTAEVVIENYFRPGREQFRRVLADNLPKALVGEDHAAVTTMKERLSKMDARNWKKIRSELLREMAP